MDRKTGSKIVAFIIALLFALQSLYCFGMASSIASMFRGAQNVRSSDPLPGIVWWYVAGGCLWLAIGMTYVLNPWRIRRWCGVLAVAALVYGLQSYHQSAPVLLSWFGIFHGDPIAFETASAAIICLLGILGIFHWALERRLP